MRVARGWREEGMGNQCSVGAEFQLGKMKKFCSPVQVAELVRALSQYAKVAGSIPHWGAYKNQPMSA